MQDYVKSFMGVIETFNSITQKILQVRNLKQYKQALKPKNTKQFLQLNDY